MFAESTYQATTHLAWKYFARDKEQASISVYVLINAVSFLRCPSHVSFVVSRTVTGKTEHGQIDTQQE